LMVFPIPRLSFGFAQLIGIMNQFKGAVLNPYTSPSFLFSSAESDKRALYPEFATLLDLYNWST